MAHAMNCCVALAALHGGFSRTPLEQGAVDMTLFRAVPQGVPTMRIRIYKGGYDPERMNLLLMIIMLAVMGSAIFYLGETLSVPPHRIAAVAPVSPL
jgi:hypothetical protein